MATSTLTHSLSNNSTDIGKGTSIQFSLSNDEEQIDISLITVTVREEIAFVNGVFGNGWVKSFYSANQNNGYDFTVIPNTKWDTLETVTVVVTISEES